MPTEPEEPAAPPPGDASGGVCTICERRVAYCIACRCGFRLCQDCLAENEWGLTCNHITWTCPDCGEARSF